MMPPPLAHPITVGWPPQVGFVRFVDISVNCAVLAHFIRCSGYACDTVWCACDRSIKRVYITKHGEKRLIQYKANDSSLFYIPCYSSRDLQWSMYTCVGSELAKETGHAGRSKVRTAQDITGKVSLFAILTSYSHHSWLRIRAKPASHSLRVAGMFDCVFVSLLACAHGTALAYAQLSSVCSSVMAQSPLLDTVSTQRVRVLHCMCLCIRVLDRMCVCASLCECWILCIICMWQHLCASFCSVCRCDV